jgi:hypothetical protein
MSGLKSADSIHMFAAEAHRQLLLLEQLLALFSRYRGYLSVNE